MAMFMKTDGGRLWGRWLLRRAAYPLILAAVLVTVVLGLRLQWNPGGTSFMFLIGTMLYFGILERFIPYDVDWHPTRQEWGQYGIYFLLTVLGGALAAGFVAAAATAVAPSQSSLPMWAEIPLALLLSSLVGYGMHRLSHHNRWLWRVHGIHHTPNKVNVGNNGVNHVFDVALDQFAVQFSLALAGFSEASVFAIGIFVLAQGYIAHANIDVHLGWLNYIVVGPEQHRLHHSTDPSEAGHFGAELSLWDHVFGSYTWRPGRQPRSVGLIDPGSFPQTRSILSSVLHPLRRRERYDTQPATDVSLAHSQTTPDKDARS
ncbi:sterol desaturase family protein [Lysobacter sp. CA199]|uniref:sterol desaturase family protein n=1 Tax=Lysobacter sp. CA199 TaxID=3455608 RepID=UPI003F8D07A7